MAVVVGVVVGTKKKDKKDDLIVNSYDNTAELLEKFPIGNPTKVQNGIEAKIQNRLLTGFENWNRGFDAWKAWGNILYTEDSIYNVHGARLTLAQYQASMDVTLKRTNILMGDFHNMLICNEYAAIYYDIITVVGERKVPGTVMEFVVFKDYGDKLGTRVVEGWGGTNDTSYASMASYQSEDEKEYEAQQKEEILDADTELRNKLSAGTRYTYTIKYPTTYLETYANTLINIIKSGFDAWNSGTISTYETWINNNFDENALFLGLTKVNRTKSVYIEEMTALFSKYDIKKVYFDNILIRDKWVAIHYRFTNTTGTEKTIGDRMEFFLFEEKDSNWKIKFNFLK